MSVSARSASTSETLLAALQRVGAGESPAEHVRGVVRRPTLDGLTVDRGGQVVELLRIEPVIVDLDVLHPASAPADRRHEAHGKRTDEPPAHVLHHGTGRLLVGDADDEGSSGRRGLVVDLEADPGEVAGPLMVAVHHGVERPHAIRPTPPGPGTGGACSA